MWDRIRSFGGGAQAGGDQGGDPRTNTFPPPPSELEVLLCPSSTVPVRHMSGSAQRSYVFSVGDSINNNYTSIDPNTSTIFRHRGPFTYRLCTRMRDFKDGTSNTISMAERDLGNPGNLRDVIGHASATVTSVPSACVATALNGYYTSGSQIDRPAQYWADGAPYFNSVAIIIPPNGPSCGAPNDMSMISVSSRHPGGAHVQLADGSVRFVNESINTGDLSVDAAVTNLGGASPYGIWGSLGTLIGSEVVGEY